MRQHPGHRNLAIFLLLAVVGCVPPQPSYYGAGSGLGAAPVAASADGASDPQSDPWEPAGEPGTSTGAAAAPAGTPSRLSITPPPGFTLQQDWWVRSVTEAAWRHDEITAGVARTLPGVPVSGDAGATLRALWQSSMPPEASGAASGLVFRRQIGDGLNAYYLHGRSITRQGEQPSAQWYVLYLVDCGASWEPLIVGGIYRHTDTTGFFEQMSGQKMAEGLAWVEPLLASARCAGARGQAIAPMEHMVGHYYYGSGASQQYVNVYTGESAGYVALSYNGEYDLRADGTLLYRHSSAETVSGATAFQGEESTGRWSVRGDLLVLEMKELRRVNQYRIASVTDLPGERVLILLDEKQAADPGAVGRGRYLTTKKR